ncbi:glycosyltransferase family 4 protein [Streptomyces sp. NPDC048606]|uniref:glycosyltransferase family 4 protein n=1 Tax=Streptomyces sp. NPDC048606 TaxID=3154726 RepID=UPI003416E233
MSSSPVPIPVPAQPYGRPPLRTVQVLGGAGAGSSAHVRSLTTGLAARGVRVTVCAPVAAEGEYDFTGAGAEFTPDAVAALRAACARADLVHAHGVRAGLRAALALSGRRAGRRVPLVVTWHGGAPEPQGMLGRLSRLLEGRVARAAAVVLGASFDQVDLARRRGARDARLAAPAVPSTAGAVDADKTRAELGAVDRPLVVAVGSLVPRRGYSVLMDAARAWRVMEPLPLLVIAGEGPLRPELTRRIEEEGLPVRLLGRRPDADRLLAAADVAVLPSRWEGRSPLAQEALRAGVALVATEVGAVPELVGDAAVLVPYGDSGALAGAVAALLADPGRRAELGEAGRAQAATWPSEDETVAQVLAVYDELMERGR